MRGRDASELLALPVRINGIELGRPVEALVDKVDDRLLGLELACGDGNLRFLPFAVARVGRKEIAVSSVLALVEGNALTYYRSHSRRLSELELAQPWIGDDGSVQEAPVAA